MAKSEEVEKLKDKQGIKEEFIEFINRVSMIDLAVGVAVGGAFTAIVNSLVNDIVMPIVGLLLGGVDFTNLAIRVPNFFGTGDEAVIAYGNFIQNVVEFLVIAWVIFLMIIVCSYASLPRQEQLTLQLLLQATRLVLQRQRNCSTRQEPTFLRMLRPLRSGSSILR